MSVFNPPLFSRLPYRKPLGRWLAGVAVLVVTLNLLVWAAVHVWIVPRIDTWREELESVATEAVGTPVRVGRIEAQNPRWWALPVWALHDVQVLDAQGQSALSVMQVQVEVSLSSLLWHQGLDRLSVDGLAIDVRRSADDRWWVAGLDVTPKGPSDGKALRWVLRQPEWRLRDVQLRWVDEFNRRDAVLFSEGQLTLTQRLGQHQAQLGITPPAAWGERLMLDAQWRGSVGSGPEPLADWVGQVHLQAPRLDAAPWVAQAAVWPGVPHALKAFKGSGALQTWVQVEAGMPTGVKVQLDWPRLSTQAHPSAPVLALRDVTGEVSAQWQPNWTVSVQGLRALTESGLRLQVDELGFGRADESGAWVDRLQARGVDARDAVALSSLWPLPAALEAAVTRWSPAAQIDELTAQWQWQAGEKGAEPQWANVYQAQGRVRDVDVVDRGAPAASALPGVRGLSANFVIDQDGGQAQLSMAPGVLSLPGILDEPLVPIEGLEGAVTWRMAGESIQAQIKSLRLATPDWRGEIEAQWRTADDPGSQRRWPGILNLDVQLRDVDAARVHRYMPLQVSTGVRRYIREGFVSGQAPKVSIRVNGDLSDLPLGRADGQAEFLVQADLRDVDFAYMPPYLHAASDPPWPRLLRANTALRFDGQALSVGPIDADLQGAPGVRVTEGQVAITELATGPARLSVSLKTQGPSPSFLSFVNRSPLLRMTGGSLAQAEATGDVSGAFALQMFFADDPQLRLQGHAAMNGMDLRLFPGTPVAQAIRGRIDFNDAGFQISPTQAQVMGEPVSLRGGTVAVAPGQPSQLAFDVQGRLSAQGLRQAGLGTVSRLAQSMTGSTDVALRVGVRGGVPEIDVRTNLVGLGLNLPAPMNKAANAALPLHLSTAVDRWRGTQAVGERWQMALGQAADQRMGADLRWDRSASTPLLTGHAWVGVAPSPLPAADPRGWTASVRLPTWDVDAWLDAVSPPPAPRPPAAVASAAPTVVDTRWWPSEVTVAVDEWRVSRRELHQVRISARHAASVWRLDLSAQEAEGRVDLTLSPTGGLDHVHARLARLNVPEAAKTDVETFIAQPSSVPALDVVIADLTFGALNLGRIEIDATNHGEGAQSTWRLNRFRMTVPEATLSASGVWAASAEHPGQVQGKSTALQFDMNIRDAGALLTRAGQPGNLSDGQGQVSGAVAWAGSPITPDVASLSGQWVLRLEKGQILKVNPGAGRLIGVLSLQSLPRRFLLDFRDAFVDGFAFDDFSGDIDVAQGVATTRNLRLRSLLADVHMDGTVDLAKRSQDIHVLIVPELNVGTASLALVTINPVLGWSTFLAQLLLRTPLKAMVTQQMHVTGTWADPQVAKINPSAPKAP
jgi:uncharacterized protein (TIGR02099 family)